MPEYAPDAKRIAFVSNRSGSEQIWVSDSEGQNPHQLTFLAGNTEASWPRWSPDGRRLLFASANSVHVIGLDGGPPSLLLRNVATTVSIAEWSPDGKWIYFSSDRTGREEVWKVKMGSSELNSEMLQVISRKVT
jgi:Tol biopolymer transport system component